MADSQTSSDPEAGQGAGTSATGGQPQGTVQDGGGDQAGGASSQSQPTDTELDEITRTVSAGGEKAVEIVKHWQRVASEKDRKLAPFKNVEDLFSTLGGGDVARGAEAVRTYIGQYNSVVTHPEAREAIMHYLATGEWVGSAKKKDDPMFSDDEDDPMAAQLKSLTKEVQELRGGSAVQQMKGHLDGFFRKEMAEGLNLGSILSDEEKGKILSGLESQIKVLSATDAGQQTLRNLNASSVEKMLMLQLPPERWLEIGERAHLRKIEKKKGAATGAATAGGTTGNEKRRYDGVPLSQALEDYAREQGIDLWKMPVGR